jgi:hypothetical protein
MGEETRIKKATTYETCFYSTQFLIKHNSSAKFLTQEVILI